MRELWVIFEDDLEGAEPVQFVGSGRLGLDRLDPMWRTRKWGGRFLHSMWVIDADGNQDDVIRIYGPVPVTIAKRYQEYLDRTSHG